MNKTSIHEISHPNILNFKLMRLV